MLRSVLLVLCLVLIPQAMSLAAIPPLKPAALEAQSRHIVIGTIDELYAEDREIRTSASINTIYTAVLTVHSAEKGNLQRGSAITIIFWRAKKRPGGWTGHTGQSDIPKLGSRIKAYLVEGDGNVFRLLEPNGWTAAPEKP